MVDRITKHDRPGGEVRMTAAMMTTKPRPAAPPPIEAAMTAEAGDGRPGFAFHIDTAF